MDAKLYWNLEMDSRSCGHEVRHRIPDVEDCLQNMEHGMQCGMECGTDVDVVIRLICVGIIYSEHDVVCIRIG